MRGTEKFTYHNIPYEVIDAGRLEKVNESTGVTDTSSHVLMVEPVGQEDLERIGTAVIILEKDDKLGDDIKLYKCTEQPIPVAAFLMQYRKMAILDRHKKMISTVESFMEMLAGSKKVPEDEKKDWELFNSKTGKKTKLDDVLFDPSGSPYLLKEGGRPPKTINVTNSSGNALDMAAGIFNLEWREVKA